MSLVDLFSAMADPTRCRVVELLHERQRPVHELAAAFDISRPAISRHLKVLKDAGLVVEAKAGRENVYSLQRARLKPMQDWLEKHRTARPKAKRVGKKAETAQVGAPTREAPIPVPAAPRSEAVVATRSEAASAGRRRATRPNGDAGIAPPPTTPQLSFFDL